ncbi:hypothetical protein [Flavobacterium tegetincola]|uniref:hypothetical protein n=1 Tax=Flavobacterium tegetincola TaxID=150172 RepID=UPI000412A2CE|nr:hypothetical protein [Flavobacterium tegetincola]
MNNFKPLFGILLAIGFLVLGIYLIQQDEEYKVIVGYSTIAFWSIVLIFAIYKKITTKKTNHQ